MMIRGFLETAINTDLPGMVRAVAREDVYSLDGRRILIPEGSRLTGEYRSGIARGQQKSDLPSGQSAAPLKVNPSLGRAVRARLFSLTPQFRRLRVRCRASARL